MPSYTLYGGKRKVRRVRRVVRRGKGFMDIVRKIGNTIKDVGSAALPVLAPIAKELGPKLLAKAIGMGRKRRVVSRKKVTMLGMGKRRRPVQVSLGSRRVKRGKGPVSGLLSLIGLGRKKRVSRGKAKPKRKITLFA